MRALLPILVLDATADSVWTGNDLYGEGITVGIFEKNNSKAFKTALEYACKEFEITDYGYKVWYRIERNQEIKVPINIKVIKGKYSYLDSRSLGSKLYP